MSKNQGSFSGPPSDNAGIDSPSSFANAAKQYGAFISKLARSFSLSGDKTDDLSQEGMIALYRAFVTYDGKSSSFSTYASLCIKRSMFSWLRKNRAENILSLHDFYKDGDAPLSQDNPELEVISRDFLVRFHESARQLLSRYEYSVFELYLQGFRPSEIAKTLSTPVKSVGNAVYRVKSKLRTGIPKT